MVKYVNLRQYSSYFLIILVVALLVVSYNIVKSFISTIFIAIILSISLFPLYKKFLKKLKNKNISSFIIVILVTLIILIPSFFLTISLIRESVNAYNIVANIDLSPFSHQLGEWFDINVDLNKYVKDSLVGFTTFVINSSRDLLNKIIEISVHAVIFLFLLFYFLRDGEKIIEGIKKNMPLKVTQVSQILKDFKETTNAVIYGIIATGVLQWIATSIGFFVLGVPNPILWGFIVFIAAILPVVGASPIWGGASIYLIATGNHLAGILLALYGMIFISGIETFIKPIIVGSRTKVHSAIILIGFIGGIKVWGVAGILMGPIILSLLVVLLRMYKADGDY